MLHIAFLMSHVTGHTSHVTRHMSHVTRYMSHITNHKFQVTCHKFQVTSHKFYVTRDLKATEIWGSNPLRRRRTRMNIYTFDIFTNHCMEVEEYEEPGIKGLKFHYLTTGPLNLPESSHMAIVKEAIRNISSLYIISNWWTGFSSWEDISGLLRSGVKLPIHTVVMEVNRRLEKIEHGEETAG